MKRNHLSIPALLIALLALSACGSDDITNPHGSGWVFELIASGREVGIYSGLATTADGTVHVAFADERRHDLYLARRQAPGDWVISEIDTVGWMGEFVTLFIDSNDHFHIAYQDIWNRRLRYAFEDGSGWTYSYPYDPNNPIFATGESPMMIERHDGIHMVELNTAARSGSRSGSVNYWWLSPGGWQKLSSFNLTYMRPFVGFTWGASGPVIGLIRKNEGGGAAVNSEFSIVRQTATDGSGPWTRQYIVDVDSYESLKYGDRPIATGFDDSGTLHLVYLGQEGVLKDTGGADVDTGVRNSRVVMKTGPGGELWLTWMKGTTLHLGRYMTGTGWERMGRIVDLDPDGRYDMHVDADGNIHVCVYHLPAQKLWYGQWEATP